MQMKSTLPKIATEFILLLIGLLIVVFAWSTAQIDEFRSIPVSVFILLIGYILLQVLKRYFFKEQNWFDWIYYLGLFGVVLPVFSHELLPETSYLFVVKLLSISLIVTPLLGLLKNIRK
jgi:hypothetical protein